MQLPVVQWLRLSLALGLVVFLPGWLLLRRALPRREITWIEGVPLAFCLGLLSNMLAGALLYLPRTGFRVVTALQILLLLILVTWQLPRARRELSAQPILSRLAGALRTWRCLPRQQLVLLAWLLAVLMLYCWSGPDIQGTGDHYPHMAYIRTVLQTQRLLPDEPYYPFVGFGMGYGLWHCTLAQLSWLAGTDVLATWTFATPVVAVLCLLSVYAFARTLFDGRHGPALLSGLLFWVGILGTYVPNALLFAAYPWFVNWVVLPSIWLGFWRYSSGGSRLWLGLGVALTLCLVLVHAIEYYFLWLSLGGYALACLIGRRHGRQTLRRTALFLGLGLLVAVPYLAFKYLAPYQSLYLGQSSQFAPAVANPAAYAPAGQTWVHKVSALYHFLFTDGKISLFHTFLAPLGYLALPVSIWLVARHRQDLRYFLAGASLVPVAAYFTIYSTGWLREHVPMFWRVAIGIPWWLTIGGCLYDWASSLRVAADRRARLTRLAAIGLVSALLLPHLLDMGRSFLPAQVQRMQEGSAVPSGALLSYLDRHVADGAVVLSDPMTSLWIPAFSDQRLVQIGHGLERTASGSARLVEVEELLFNSHQATSEAIATLDRYRVDYLVLSPRAEYWWEGLGMNQDLMPIAIEFALNNPHYFTPVYSDGIAWVFACQRSRVEQPLMWGKDEPLPEPQLEQPVMEHAAEVTWPAAFTLLGYNLDRTTTSPGEDLDIRLVWKSALGWREPYMLMVTLEARQSVPKGIYLQKLHRRASELIQRKSTKTNTALALSPKLAMFVWRRPGEVFTSDATIRIPDDAVAGTYDLAVYAVAESEYERAIFLERLILEDRYRFAGQIVGELEITPP